MSEFHVVVVQIAKVGKLPNSDNLEITQVMNAYPCIFRAGQFKPGDKAVYCPIDSLVPTSEPRWAFLKGDNDRTYERIKAKKVRGVFSMGLLTEADPSWEIGQNVQAELHIEKWEPQVPISTEGENIKDSGVMPVYTDIEGLRKYKELLVPGEEVVLQCKIHGSNGRWVFAKGSGISEGDDRLFSGSHKNIKCEGQSMWWRVAEENKLAEKLSKYPDKVFYGEVYGQVQKGYQYGVPAGQIRVTFFDIFDPVAGKYLDFDEMQAILKELNLDTPPILYRGPWSEELIDKYQNGPSMIPGAQNIREGFVCRPVKERWEYTYGRVILKIVGSEFLLKAGKIKE